jgi:2-amino-4-hydroxy-6-hydroxymethyldihydropteridine diphosphokinase
VTVRAAIALGANLGDRALNLAHARDAIGRLAGTQIVRASTVEETAPLGDVPQGPYLNQMLLVETELAPRDLLDALLAIEQAMGRDRAAGERWGPRIIDCDIVLYGDEPVVGPELVIPHPELPHRDFWRRELAELGVTTAFGGT